MFRGLLLRIESTQVRFGPCLAKKHVFSKLLSCSDIEKKNTSFSNQPRLSQLCRFRLPLLPATCPEGERSAAQLPCSSGALPVTREQLRGPSCIRCSIYIEDILRIPGGQHS